MDRYRDGYPTGTDKVSSSSKWTLQAPNYILNGYFTRLSLTQVQMFYNLPTVITGYNDKINFSKYGSSPPYTRTQYVATIAQGFYNPQQLAFAIPTAMNLVTAGSFTVPATLAKPLGNLSLIGNAAFTIDVASTPDSPAGRFYQTSGLIPSPAFASPGVSTGSYGVPSLLATRFIDITSSYLTKFQRVKDASTLSSGSTQNILTRVYATPGSSSTPWPPVTQTNATTSPYTTTWTFQTPGPFIVNQEPSNPKQLAWNPDEVISNFDITLLDEYGGLVPWDTDFGCEYNLSMMASET